MLKERNIMQDRVFQLLMLNMLAVLVSYSYNTVNTQISSASTILRQVIVAFSIVHLLIYRVKNRLSGIVFFLPIAILFSSIFNFSLLDNLSKVLTFIIPYFYVCLVINYLLNKYPFESLLNYSVIGINLIYLYPVLTYFILDTGFERVNIYGIREGSYFVSNHYGWSATIYICSLPVVLNFFRKSLVVKILLLVCFILAIYLVIVSANRSSLLSLGIALPGFMLLGRSVFELKGLRLLPVVFIAPLLIFLSLKDNKDSAINFLKAKNEKQFESSQLEESRFVVTSFAYKEFNEEPYLWITGLGIFNHRFIQSATNLRAYHNSYWEILFGCGIPIFLMFLAIMVFRPLRLLIQKKRGDLVLIIPLIIIPFFESNITGGQFLFFPWFFIMLLMNLKSNILKKTNRQAQVFIPGAGQANQQFIQPLAPQ